MRDFRFRLTLTEGAGGLLPAVSLHCYQRGNDPEAKNFELVMANAPSSTNAAE